MFGARLCKVRLQLYLKGICRFICISFIFILVIALQNRMGSVFLSIIFPGVWGSIVLDHKAHCNPLQDTALTRKTYKGGSTF